MPIPSQPAPRRFRGATEWADRVVDHRSVELGTLNLPPLPVWLPVPGCSSANEVWDEGTVEFTAPDTSHLPSGGRGGLLSISAHVLGGGTERRYVITVITFPDGYRLGSIWPTNGRTRMEAWREWMASHDGMGHAFTRVATPWSVTQRAWAARRWYDFAAAAPDGASLPANDWKVITQTATSGISGPNGPRLVKALNTQQINALQRAGFWLPDPAQTDWLGGAGTPLASAVPDDTIGACPEATRLYDMYASGWTAQARLDWFPAHPSPDAAVRLRDFLTATRGWDEAIAEACVLMRDKADDTSTGEASEEVVRTGEIASLCLRLGYTPFHVGVMVGEGTFEVEALRTMVALRDSGLTATS